MLLVINNSDWTWFMCAWGNADNVVPMDSVICWHVKSVDGITGLTYFSLLAGMWTEMYSVTK